MARTKNTARQSTGGQRPSGAASSSTSNPESALSGMSQSREGQQARLREAMRRAAASAKPPPDDEEEGEEEAGEDEGEDEDELELDVDEPPPPPSGGVRTRNVNPPSEEERTQQALQGMQQQGRGKGAAAAGGKGSTSGKRRAADVPSSQKQLAVMTVAERNEQGTEAYPDTWEGWTKHLLDAVHKLVATEGIEWSGDPRDVDDAMAETAELTPEETYAMQLGNVQDGPIEAQGFSYEATDEDADRAVEVSAHKIATMEEAELLEKLVERRDERNRARERAAGKRAAPIEEEEEEDVGLQVYEIGKLASARDYLPSEDTELLQITLLQRMAELRQEVAELKELQEDAAAKARRATERAKSALSQPTKQQQDAAQEKFEVLLQERARQDTDVRKRKADQEQEQQARRSRLSNRDEGSSSAADGAQGGAADMPGPLLTLEQKDALVRQLQQTIFDLRRGLLQTEDVRTARSPPEEPRITRGLALLFHTMSPRKREAFLDGGFKFDLAKHPAFNGENDVWWYALKKLMDGTPIDMEPWAAEWKGRLAVDEYWTPAYGVQIVRNRPYPAQLLDIGPQDGREAQGPSAMALGTPAPGTGLTVGVDTLVLGREA